MDTIKIIIDYVGEVTINDEYTTSAPIEMDWFPDNDLIIETPDDKIVFNSNAATPPYIIRPKTPSKDLHIVEGATLQLAENDDVSYLIINDKYAYKLPKRSFDIT